jgi:hypothetical protein
MSLFEASDKNSVVLYVVDFNFFVHGFNPLKLTARHASLELPTERRVTIGSRDAA